jgi:O-antigen ligase
LPAPRAKNDPSEKEVVAAWSPAAKIIGATIFSGLVALIILTPIPYGSVEAWAQGLFECLVFILAALWIVHGLISGSWRPENSQLFYPLIALIGYAMLQSLSWSQTQVAGVKVVNAISADPFESWLFALRVSALTLAGVMALRFTNSSARLKVLVHLIIALAVISSIFGIVRQGMQHDQGFVLPALRYGGGFAQFINKNHFAFLVEPAIGLLLGITVLREHHRRHLLVYGSALLLLWVALVMSRSRGGLLAVTVEMIFAALLFIYLKQRKQQEQHRPRRWIYSLGVTAATTFVLVAAIIGGVVWLGGDQLTTGIQTAATEISGTASHEGANRRDIWAATWRMARAHSILGAGLGGFWAEVPVFHDASGVQTPAQAHNDYLELLASAGLVGLAVFAWFVVVLAKRVRRVFRDTSGFQRSAQLGAVVGIAGIAVHSLVDFGLHMTGNALVFVMLLSILSTGKIANGRSRKRIKKHRSDNVLTDQLTIHEEPHRIE